MLNRLMAPFFNKFRVPSMILVVPAFALAILAARGLERLGREGVPAALLDVISFNASIQKNKNIKIN